MDFEHFQRAVAIAPRLLFVHEYLAEQLHYAAQLSSETDANSKLHGTTRVLSTGQNGSADPAGVVAVGSASGFDFRSAQLSLPGGVKISLDDDLVRREGAKRRDGVAARSGGVGASASTQSSVVYFPELHHSSGVMSDSAMDHSGSLDADGDDARGSNSVISSSMMMMGQTPASVGAPSLYPAWMNNTTANTSFGSRTHRNSIVDRLHVDELEYSERDPAQASASSSTIMLVGHTGADSNTNSYTDVVTRVDGEVTSSTSPANAFGQSSSRIGLNGAPVKAAHMSLFGVSNSPGGPSNQTNATMYTLARPTEDFHALPASQATPPAFSTSTTTAPRITTTGGAGNAAVAAAAASSSLLQPPGSGHSVNTLAPPGMDGGLDFAKAVSNSYSYSDFGLGATELVEVASLLEHSGRSGALREDASSAPVTAAAAAASSLRIPQPPLGSKSQSPRPSASAAASTSGNPAASTSGFAASLPTMAGSTDGGAGPLSSAPLPITPTVLRYSLVHAFSRPGPVAGVCALEIPYRVAVCSAADSTVRVVSAQPARVAENVWREAIVRFGSARPAVPAPPTTSTSSWSGNVVSILQADANTRHCSAPPSGKYLCVCTAAGSSLVYDLTSGKAPLLLNHHGMSVLSSFSPSGRCIAVGTDDGWVTVWQLRGTTAASVVASFTGLQGNRAVTSLSWQPGDGLLGAGSADQIAVIWNATTTATATTVRHPQPVNSVSFDSTGRFFLSCCPLNIVVTSADTGSMLLSIANSSPSWSRLRSGPMTFVACTFLTSALPQHVLVGCSDKTLRVVRLLHVGGVLPLGHSAELLCERITEVPNLLAPAQTKEMDEAVMAQGATMGAGAWAGAYIGDCKGDVYTLTLQPASAAFAASSNLEPPTSPRSLKRRAETSSAAAKGSTRL